MSRTVIAAAVASLVLTGCTGTSEPAQPPTSEDALTTTSPATEEAAVTSEAPPTTEEPEETEAAGPPEMPEEAKEQTEAGAEAFVEHYVQALNYAYVTGDDVGLRDYSTPNCSSCDGLREGIPAEGTRNDYLRLDSPSAELLDGTARVTGALEQLSGDGAGRGTVVFRLQEDDSVGWIVDSITLAE